MEGPFSWPRLDRVRGAGAGSPYAEVVAVLAHGHRKIE